MSNRLRLIRWLAGAALVSIVALGAWMYFPRDNSTIFLGLRVETDCKVPPKAEVAGNWTDVDSYVLSTAFDYTPNSDCSLIRITSPGPFSDLLGVRSINKPVGEATWEEIRSSRQPIRAPAVHMGANSVGQPVVDINLRALAEPPAIIDMRIHSVRAEAFERFRITLPRAFTEERRDSADLKELPLLLTSFVISSDFNLVEAVPSPTGRRRSLGSEIIYFGGAALSELSIVVTSRTREWWKQIYSLIVVGVLCSLLAAWIYSRVASQH